MTDNDDKGAYPGAHPTAPGGMSQEALRTELADKHGVPLEGSEGMSWPDLINAVCQARLAREAEEPEPAAEAEPAPVDRHLTVVPEPQAALGDVGVHDFVRSAEGSGRICMAEDCGQAQQHPVHTPWSGSEAVDNIPGHTRTPYSDNNGGHGPDYCLECSRHIHEWVQWPCTGTLPERCEQHQMAKDVCPDCSEEKRKLAEQAAYVFEGEKQYGHSREGDNCQPEICGGSRYDPCTYPPDETKRLEELALAEWTREEQEHCLHDLRRGECADCLGIKAPEVVAVALGAELVEQAPVLKIWTETLGVPPVAGPHPCKCDAETKELMGCVCGGTPGLAVMPPPPIPVVPAYQPPAPVSEPPPYFTPFPPAPVGGTVSVSAETTPTDEGSPMAEAPSTADAAVRPVRKFSNSELRTFKRCRRKWYLTFYRGLSLRKQGVGPLSIGNMVHHPLEMYYGTPSRDPETFDWETPLAEHVEARLADPDLPDHLHADMLADYELVKIMLRGYFAWIMEEGADSELEILSPEREIEAYLDQIEGTDVWIIGKLDVEAEIKSDGRRVFIDHKSCANLSDIPKTGQLDEQQRQYGLLQRLEAAALKAAGLPYPETFTRGGIWNMLRKVKRTATAKPPFYGRASVSHNDDVFRNFYKRVWGEVRDILVTMRNLDAGGDHQVEVYPNPTRDCSWDCPFFAPGVCAMMDDGSDVEAVISLEFTQHDPYARYTELEKG